MSIFNLRIHIIDKDKDDVRNRHEDMKTRNAFSGALGAPGNARCWEESWCQEVPGRRIHEEQGSSLGERNYLCHKETAP